MHLIRNIGLDSEGRPNPDLGTLSRGSFSPLLAPILRNRKRTRLLIGVAALQILLVRGGLPGWPCPIQISLGIPCPGCGLSRAMGLLLQCEWQAGIAVHAFAPVFLIGFCATGFLCLLPGPLYAATLKWIARFEEKTGIIPFMFAGIVIYWGFRLIGFFSTPM